MIPNIHQIRTLSATAVCVTLVALAGPASAVSILNLTSIDTAGFGSITGAVDSTLTNTYDFIPQITGGDGQITSTVYNGAGAASGSYVYSYSIELYGSNQASVGAVVGLTFHFGSFPSSVGGANAFFVDDGSGNKAPDLAFYDDATQTAGFRFIPIIGNGETSLTFGLVSDIAPAATVAQMIDSGATGGTVTILSNGVLPPVGSAPVPEPAAALVFALGFGAIARRCSQRA
jgi:hypothetical protein